MKINVALIQFTPGYTVESVPDNRETVVKMIHQAMRAPQRPDLIMLPEAWQAVPDRISAHPMDQMERAEAMQEPIDGPSITGLQTLAKQYHVWIAAGSIKLKKPGSKKPYNSQVILDRSGNIAGVYDKNHLCEWVGENKATEYGNGIVPVETEFGILAPILCYDIRFEELIRGYVLAGAKFLLVPACFQTNLVQWRALLQARATENQMYVFGCNCCGDNPASCKGLPYQVDAANQQILKGQGHVHYMGHSMIVDPTAEILAEAGDEPCILTAEIDTDRVDLVRSGVFYTDSIRPELYTHYKKPTEEVTD